MILNFSLPLDVTLEQQHRWLSFRSHLWDSTVKIYRLLLNRAEMVMMMSDGLLRLKIYSALTELISLLNSLLNGGLLIKLEGGWEVRINDTRFSSSSHRPTKAAGQHFSFRDGWSH